MKDISFQNGDTYLEYDEIKKYTVNYLKFNILDDDFKNLLDELRYEGKIVLEKDLYYIKQTYNDETYIADKINTYPRPYTIINPGKLKDNPRQGRTWNINNWKTLAKNILNQYGGTVFVTGNKKEQEYHNKLNDNNIVVLSGLFSLEESCSVLSMADLVIS